jgi:hypothetical protein
MGFVATHKFSEQLAHASEPMRPEPCRSGSRAVSTTVVEDDRGTMLLLEPSMGYLKEEEEFSSTLPSLQ